MIEEFFGEGGRLQQHSPRYEPRPGQIRMAGAVERAIAEKFHLAVEAPCGIGKTYAYLIPAILHAQATNSRVIVCTANIALQEQIYEKDLPALARILPRRFTYALIKGINNYLCLDRWEEARGQIAPFTYDKAELDQWRRLIAWRDKTRTGDVSDLDFEPDPATWNRVNGVSEMCHGRNCGHYEDCFAMDARRRVRGAQVIVTNYHLFFAHLKVRAAGAGDVVLPPASVVVCDEAHDMADIARDFFGMRLTPASSHVLVRGANYVRHGGFAEQFRQASRRLFDRIRKAATGQRLKKPHWFDADEMLGIIGGYKDYLREEAEKLPESEEKEKEKIRMFSGAADHYASTLTRFLQLDDPNLVYWISKQSDATRLHARAIDVGPIIDAELFKKTPTVVLASATLTANGRFDFLKRETGGEDARELRVDSPFDYRRQMILVVPRMESLPNDPGFAEEVSGHLNRIIRLLGGRTMCLFTSYRNLSACAEAAAETGATILRQGEAPRSKLLERFRKDEGTALFATASFWQGVDVPGDALSCLAIDKIPFMPPGDPLLEALQERDPACFTNYSLPKAILDLRQGFGRLIRTKRDRGVVVIFDNRLFKKRYGADAMASLPDCPVHRDLDALENFFTTAGAPVE